VEPGAVVGEVEAQAHDAHPAVPACDAGRVRLPVRLLVLFAGCIVLGVGVAMLLTANLGSDGYSTLVRGLSLATGLAFWSANVVVGVIFLAVASWRRVYPGVGTVLQVVVVGAVVTWLLDVIDPPDSMLARIALLVGAMVVITVGITSYLGSQLGAAPIEAAGLAWDPPVPFRWSYSAVQLGGSLLGWWMGATIGAGTVAVIVLLGPMVNLASRLMRLDVHQGRTMEGSASASS
jgi:uncharacterized membrane protein YczE